MAVTCGHTGHRPVDYNRDYAPNQWLNSAYRVSGLIVCGCCAGPAQDAPKAAAEQEDKGKDDKKPPEEKTSQTKHSIQIGGKEIKYTATAERCC